MKPKKGKPLSVNDFTEIDEDEASSTQTDDKPDKDYDADIQLQQIRLTLPQTAKLKEIIDKEINPNFEPTEPSFFNFSSMMDNNSLEISVDNSKLKRIPVSIERIEKEDLLTRILVKVGPCDLSGVGGHDIRKEMIESLVNYALAAQVHIRIESEHGFA